MSKTGKLRTFSICLSDIPKERILKHTNGKLYLNLQSFDYDQPDKYDNDFSVSLVLNEEEKEAKKRGEQIHRIFLGNGRIWEDNPNLKPATQEDLKDLPF